MADQRPRVWARRGFWKALAAAGIFVLGVIAGAGAVGGGDETCEALSTTAVTVQR